MYVHVEYYVDDQALAMWLEENGYDVWDGSNLDQITDYINENQPMTGDAVKIL